MGRKIFVSYKYYDADVERLSSKYDVESFNGKGMLTTARSYVTYIEQNILANSDNIYKGEHKDEDLSDKSDDYIWEKLKDKLYDTSVTIVLISPNMKVSNRWERSQWIPWEIAYSLRKVPRNGRTSHPNAILAVVLPDKNGNYEYYEDLQLFRILKANIDNAYIPVYKWSYFRSNFDYCVDAAVECRKSTPDDLVVKSV